MIRRTSGSSIVRQVRACGANGAVPLTMASAIEFSVRTCRPGRSARALAHLLLRPLVERHQADAPTPAGSTAWRRCRARSVSTRVLPDPAGAMIRGAATRVGHRGELVGSEVGG